MKRDYTGHKMVKGSGSPYLISKIRLDRGSNGRMRKGRHDFNEVDFNVRGIPICL